MDNISTGNMFSWDIGEFDKRKFHLYAALLALCNPQQLLAPTTVIATQIPQAEIPEIKDAETSSESDVDDVELTIRPRKLAERAGKDDLKPRFLDRLAEVMAPEACPRKTAGDVCATALLTVGKGWTVFVAKNDGLTVEDGKMLSLLQMWMRSVAERGERRDVRKDILWRRLVKFYARRLLRYKSVLQECFAALGAFQFPRTEASMSMCEKLEAVRTFCGRDMMPGVEEDLQSWFEIVDVCFELRYETELLPFLEGSIRSARLARKIQRGIAFLGRLRAAYETFIECALHFNEVKAIRLEGVTAPAKQRLPRYQTSEIQQILEENHINLGSLDIREHGKPVKGVVKRKSILQNDLRQKIGVHAEVQILAHLIGPDVPHENDVHQVNYIGCSKKPCHFCSQLLYGFYKMRPSHGQVFSRWTIPDGTIHDAFCYVKIQGRLMEMERNLLQKVQAPGSKRLDAIATSTVAMTEFSQGATARKSTRKIDTDRLAANISLGKQSRRPKMLGKLVKRVQALRIPADGSNLQLVSIPIRVRTDQSGHHDPDFEGFWLQELEPLIHNLDVKAQNPAVLNGSYRLYYTLSEDLPLNKYIGDMVASNGIPSERFFWQGDAFLVKLGSRWIRSEKELFPLENHKPMIEINSDKNGATLYEDVPPEYITSDDLLERLFHHKWENEELEKYQQREQEGQFQMQEMDLKKEIWLSKMSPEERDVIETVPALGEYLACSTGVYGIRPLGMSKDPTNPEMVVVHSEHEVTTLERMGWKGFQSNQL